MPIQIKRLPASEAKALNEPELDTLRGWGFIPVVINDAYLPHMDRPERIQIWYGGSGSGKSDAKATELLLKCLYNPRFLFL